MRGATLSKASGSSTPNYFNPRAPCGARRAKRKLLLIPRRYFNPRAPCGARLLGSILAANTQIISIHAPHAGRDGSYSHNHGAQHISIYAPREGRDPRMSAASIRCSKFQSTRPARGATCLMGRIGRDLELFQSTRPARGATMADALNRINECISIHAPREGRDPNRVTGEMRSAYISIHAPREGRDRSCKTADHQKSNFNPRAPRGARHEPRGFRALDRTHFNPRAPRGARLNASRAKCATIKISIHAPREGRDW